MEQRVRIRSIIILLYLTIPMFSMGQSLNPVQNPRHSYWCYNGNFLWDEPDSSGNTLIQYLIYEDSVLVDSAINRYFSRSFEEGEYVISVSAQYEQGESGLTNIYVNVPQGKGTHPMIEHHEDFFKIIWLYPHYHFLASYILEYLPPYNSVAYNAGDSATYAIKYPWGSLSGDFIAEITHVRFVPSDEQGQALEYHLKIFQGNDTTKLLYFANIEDIVYNEWNIVEIDPPLIVEATEDVWFGITIVNDIVSYNYGGIGIDNYYPYGNDGALYSINDTLWDNYEYGDWCILGYFTNWLYYADKSYSTKQTDGVLVEEYNVYKNGEFLTTTTQREYVDYDFNLDDCNQYFEYGIEVSYGNCTSAITFVGDTLGCTTYLPDLKRDSVKISIHPNPFTTSTTIEYELIEPTHVQLTIYNAIGEVVYSAEDRLIPVGKHSFTWSPERLPEGMYYAVLRSEDGVSVVKMIKQ